MGNVVEHGRVQVEKEAVETFLNTRLSNYSSYDNLRKIASYIDGLKNASRKVLYTIHEKKITETEKVSRLASKCSEYSDYLHGDGLWRVIVTLGQDFAGTNNIPLIQKFGAFGCRSNTEPGAPRYIHASGSKAFFELFDYKDDPILVHQTFEGSKIEPRFYVPVIPMILVNGSEGVSSGFAQKILARNPKSIVKYILNVLSGKPIRKDWLMPYYNGFAGTIRLDDPLDLDRWTVSGVVEREKDSVYLIKELPFTYDLSGYLKVLDTLEESKIIQSYQDLSDGDSVMQFRVKVPKDFDHQNALKILKLEKYITENYTCIDENNKIQVFKSPEQIVDAFIKVKLEYTEKRRVHLIEKLRADIAVLNSKVLFVKGVINKTITVSNTPKAQIVKKLENIKEIVKVKDSYDYLLGMSIGTLTKEKVQELEANLAQKNKELRELERKTAKDLWIEDLTVIQRLL